MRKSIFIVPLLAVALASCSSDEPANGNGVDGQGETNYLSVNLVTAPSTGSRAVEDADNYEDGIESEFAVKKVRFYFFGDEGAVANVKKDGETSVNYFDWAPAELSEGEAPNVEKIVKATLIINTAEGDGLPKSVVAIINPIGLPTGSLTLENLEAEVDSYIGTVDTENGFVMSNAVYANGSNKMVAVSVDGHLYTSQAAALSDPVTIYVERVLAKVRMKTAFTDNNLIPTAGEGVDDEFNGTKLYAKFLGWNVTATADNSRLMKEINPAWPDNLFGSADEPWNYPAYFRSFWAVNPDGLEYSYGSFDKETATGDNVPNVANGIEHFTSGTEDNPLKNYTYLQENATSNFSTGESATTPSKVIIAAQLVDENGKPVEFAEWGFERFTVDGLKARLLQAVTFYKKKTEGGATSYTGISSDDIEFKTATTIGEAGPNTPGRYYVFAQLTEKAESYTWCTSNAENAPVVSAAVVNKAFKDLGHAKIWTNGYTYYYLDIKHLGNAVGVVRNHLYDVNIKTLKGLGTPVYDPDEKIYPEKPGDEDTFIAAEIKILSWRLVKQDVDLEW